MGCSHNCRFPHLIMSMLFLLVSTSTHFRITAGGRAAFKLLETSSHMGDEEKAIIRSQIGSRPPRCDRRCSSCGHCEAIQVPAVPQVKTKTRHFTTASMRGEDSSNYKPMSWKCKCGDMIFNP